MLFFLNAIGHTEGGLGASAGAATRGRSSMEVGNCSRRQWKQRSVAHSAN